jgi:hypothetical protein
MGAHENQDSDVGGCGRWISHRGRELHASIERGRRRTRQDQISLGKSAGEIADLKIRTERRNLFLLPDRFSKR